jgi:cytochrome c2
MRRTAVFAVLGFVAVSAIMRSAAAQQRSAYLNQAKFSAEAASIFNKRCSACHTYGKGIKVGPDLKGVTERRTREWLFRFIRQSSSVIKSGDPTAMGLFVQFQKQRMPDWTDLSEKQINDTVDYLAAGGPEVTSLDERNAELATAEEIEEGRRLFYGQIPFQHQAKPCVGCHTVQGSGLRGGTLGSDLTRVYSKYQDKALSSLLANPCSQWDSAASATNCITAQESFALKAFLWRTCMRQPVRAVSVAAERSSNP